VSSGEPRDSNNGVGVNILNPSQSGLTADEKKRATEITALLVQGMCTSADFDLYNYLYRKDPDYFITAQLNGILIHPAFNDEERVIDNWHKNALIKLKHEEIKNKGKLQSAQTVKINIGEINKLMKLNKAEDGIRFGMLPPKVVVPENIEPEFEGNESRDVDVLLDELGNRIQKEPVVVKDFPTNVHGVIDVQAKLVNTIVDSVSKHVALEKNPSNPDEPRTMSPETKSEMNGEEDVH
jgi:hypothetical protein